MDRFRAYPAGAGTMVWPTPDTGDFIDPERILLFESTGGRPLVLASNYPYELWLDGHFAGDGGHRCVPGEALADGWPEAAEADSVQVRLQWLNPQGFPLCYRAVFPDAFFMEIPTGGAWSCALDVSIQWAARMSVYLPHQNIVYGPPERGVELPLVPVAPARSWSILEPPIERCQYQRVAPKRVARRVLPAHGEGEFLPEVAKDLAKYVHTNRPCALACDTYDLGQIALYRFEVDAGARSCVLFYSEVADFEAAWSSRDRRRAALADAVVAGVQYGAPFGTRGCRYVHVLYPVDSANPPNVYSWRRVYPLRWKPVRVVAAFEPVVAACRANLIACVDGGIVDTCWRERVQWAGDARMAAMALRTLADNPEVVDLVLHQLATSYRAEIGMVDGAWPFQHSRPHFAMPTYHLAFCLAAVENDPALCRDPLIAQVVRESIEFWKRHYLKDGLLQGMPGWYFTDWDPVDAGIAGQVDPAVPHAVCNAWWSNLCEQLGEPAELNATRFDRLFWKGRGYRLTPLSSGLSVHATAVVVTSPLGQRHRQDGLEYLEDQLASDALFEKVTAYFAYFVGKALLLRDRSLGLTFLRRFYLPIARTYGSLFEKNSDNGSLAHGWSVAVASLLPASEEEE